MFCAVSKLFRLAKLMKLPSSVIKLKKCDDMVTPLIALPLRFSLLSLPYLITIFIFIVISF